MILADSSAWIEYLRRTGSPVNVRMRVLLDGGLLTCGPVRMEVLAGARDDRHRNELVALLARADAVETEAVDFDEAADLYRRCRRGGETVRRMVDCLIAAHAIRAGVPVLHADGDFAALARHTAVRLEPA